MKNITKTLAEKAYTRLDSAQEKQEPVKGLFEQMGQIFNPDFSDMLIKKIK